MSQNCVSRISPPGALKQQRSPTAVVLEQLNGMSLGQVTDAAMVEPTAKAASASTACRNIFTIHNRDTLFLIKLRTEVLSINYRYRQRQPGNSSLLYRERRVPPPSMFLFIVANPRAGGGITKHYRAEIDSRSASQLRCECDVDWLRIPR